jgi:hypothetical protein
MQDVLFDFLVDLAALQGELVRLCSSSKKLFPMIADSSGGGRRRDGARFSEYVLKLPHAISGRVLY